MDRARLDHDIPDAEVIGGILTKSLALLSDAAHMFTDAAALAIALVAIRIGKRVADRKRTFGYRRFEIIAAAFNAGVLFMVAFYILYEAVQRFRSPEPVASGAMLIIATLGLLVNFIGMWLLRGRSEHSLNVKGAYLEVWSDMLGSLGVIVAAALISWTGLHVDRLVGGRRHRPVGLAAHMDLAEGEHQCVTARGAQECGSRCAGASDREC